LDAAVSVSVVALIPPADSLTVNGVNDAVGRPGPAPLLEGRIDDDIFTGPVKPVLFSPIVIVTEEFDARLWLDVLGFREKSPLTEIVRVIA
jgi:hypothetical protein